MQREQQERKRKKRGIADDIGPVKPFGIGDKQSKQMEEMNKRMKDMEDWIALQEEAIRRMSGVKWSLSLCTGIGIKEARDNQLLWGSSMETEEDKIKRILLKVLNEPEFVNYLFDSSDQSSPVIPSSQ